MRKLRSYKGVWYGPERQRWKYEGMTYASAAHVIINLPFLGDDDHAALMDLKANPYEPVKTLDEVVLHALHQTRNVYALTLEERAKAITEILRTAFPHIDQEGS